MTPKFNASWVALAAALQLGVLLSSAASACEGRAFPPQFADAAPFRAAISAVSLRPGPKIPARGLTVPHHLLAADLIARGFAAVQPERYDKIVVLLPDHFRRTRRAFATTTRSFKTVFGDVCTNKHDAALLLGKSDIVEDSDLFGTDHAIGALLPFIRHSFPDIPIVPVAVSIVSRRAHWDALLEQLDSIVTDRTLVVQSTDFSHFLTPGEAARRDQITLNLIAASDADGTGRLMQPSHLDSVGSQYLQMQLQRRRSRHAIVLFNRNSQEYSSDYVAKTTSYIVQIYPREPERQALTSLPRSRVMCLVDESSLGAAPQSKTALRGCPLVVTLGSADRAKPAADLVSSLKGLGAVAASVIEDCSTLSSEDCRDNAATLRRAGIAVLEPGQIVDLGPARIVALLPGYAQDGQPDAPTAAAIDVIGSSPARPPLIALVRARRNSAMSPGPNDPLAEALTNAGVSMIIDTRAASGDVRLRSLNDGEALLAQMPAAGRSQEQSLELRLFDQGTFFARAVGAH